MKTARYPLVEAIRSAEMQGNGPAVDAELVSGAGHRDYEATVLNADKTVREDQVDAGGKVAPAQAFTESHATQTPPTRVDR